MKTGLDIRLIPILQTAEENRQFDEYPQCTETLFMSIEYYTRIGFIPPWVCYFVASGRELVGSAGFKGRPRDGKVEIAYGTFDQHQQKGVGTAICRELVRLAKQADPSVKITARTIPDNLGSIGVLKNNNFVYLGQVMDDEDGEVCEWEFINLPDHGM